MNDPTGNLDDPYGGAPFGAMTQTGVDGGGVLESAPGVCRYCGAPLERQVYFCLRCATPYKPIEHLLPVVRPQPPTDSQLIKQKAPQAMNIFYIYLGLLITLSVIYAMSHRADRAAFFVFAEVAMLATTLILATMYWKSLAAQFARAGFFRWEAWAGVAALAPLMAIQYGWAFFVSEGLGLEAESPFDALREMGFGQTAMILTIAVFPAVTEEIAFRGLVQHWLTIAVGSRKAILYASLLFTVLHFNVLIAPYILVVGLLLGWVKDRTGSLYPPIAIHFLHNLAVLAIFGQAVT